MTSMRSSGLKVSSSGIHWYPIENMPKCEDDDSAVVLSSDDEHGEVSSENDDDDAGNDY